MLTIDIITRNLGFLGSIVTLIILTTYTIIKKGQHIQLIKLLTNKKWLINFIFIILWSAYILLLVDPKNSEEVISLKKAVKKAIIAFIIALFAFFDLTIIPFWLVFTFAYYSEDWI